METTKMSIHAGLGELKKLKSRMDKRLLNISLIGNMKQTAVNVNTTALTQENFTIEAKAQYQSVTDMISRYEKIKSAIDMSNSNTTVVIGKQTMTVTEAIVKKTNIETKKRLLASMEREYSHIIANTTARNERVESDLDNQIAQLGGKDSSGTALTGFMEQYRKSNGWIIVDPLNLKEVITTLDSEIDDFENNVDVVLSESNATTFIEI